MATITEPKYLGDDGCSSWDLPPGHIWAVTGAEFVYAVFTDLSAAWAYADAWNRDVNNDGDQVVVDYEPLDPTYEP